MKTYTLKKAWELACEHSGETGENCAVLRKAKGKFVFTPFLDGTEPSVRLTAEALGAKFVKRTFVLK